MADEKQKGAVRGSGPMDQQTAGSSSASGSREESMGAIESDGSESEGTVRPPDPADQGDGTSDDRAGKSPAVQRTEAEGGEKPGRDAAHQNPASSGTTSLGGEPADAESMKSSGGVEGTG